MQSSVTDRELERAAVITLWEIGLEGTYHKDYKIWKKVRKDYPSWSPADKKKLFKLVSERHYKLKLWMVLTGMEFHRREEECAEAKTD